MVSFMTLLKMSLIAQNLLFLVLLLNLSMFWIAVLVVLVVDF